MKALFISHNQCTSKYSRYPKGWEFVGTFSNESEIFRKIDEREEIFPQDTGTIYDCNGREVFDPNYPNRYEFGDYTYFIEELAELDQDTDSHKIEAILKADPWNLQEIKAILGIKSDACSYALRLMDEDFDYQEAVILTIEKFDGVYRSELEKELDQYI